MVFATLGAAALGAAADHWSQNQAAKKQFSYQKKLSNMNFEQQKYFAQNAHQLEAEDLKKAGYNPALTATGGSGASASGGGIPGAQGITPIDMIGSMKTLIDAKNQTSATNSQNELNRAQAMNTIANTDNIPTQNRIAMMNALANQTTAEANTTNATTNKRQQLTNQQNANTNAKNARTNARNSTINKRRSEFENAKDQSQIYKDHGGKISDVLGNWYWYY